MSRLDKGAEVQRALHVNAPNPKQLSSEATISRHPLKPTQPLESVELVIRSIIMSSNRTRSSDCLMVDRCGVGFTR